jgi:hypothetical protein
MSERAMSRGEGRLQRCLISLFLEKAPQALTFAEIRAEVCKATGFEEALFPIVHNSLERSIRRALHGLIEGFLPGGGRVITIGHGGRKEPYRYALSPVAYTYYGMPEDEARKKWDEIEAGDCKELKRALAGWGLTAAQRAQREAAA